MQFDKAIKKSVKAFIGGSMPEQLNGMKEEGLMYTPEYFDDMQERYESGEVPDNEELETDDAA